jgi:hypothetical protein
VIIATFNATTGWAGRTITHDDGRFSLEGHGPLTAQEVLTYDAAGQLDWAYDGLRAWVGSQASPVATAAVKKKAHVWAWVLLGGVVVVVLIAIVAALSSMNTAIDQADSSYQGAMDNLSGAGYPDFTLTADELGAAYGANEISADAQYKGHVVRLTGRAGDISKDWLGGAYVMLETEDWDSPSIRCMLADGQESPASAIQRGDTVTLVGTVDGMFVYLDVVGCTVD